MLEIVSNETNNNAKILVIGVGGGGNNAVDRMISEGIAGVEYLCVNTDAQQLKKCLTANVLQIGANITKGLGAGANPEVGKAAANESSEDIANAIRGKDMVFIACGMGGGTGTGAAPVIAEIAKNMGILTVAAVTKPFTYEGAVRKRNADSGIAELTQYVDTLIIVPNDKLLDVCDKKISLKNALKVADSVLQQGIQGITDLITTTGMINLDFADIKAAMTDKGRAYFGVGIGSGENKCVDAVKAAIENPLVETALGKASHVILNYRGDAGVLEISEASDFVQGIVGEDASIFFGVIDDETLGDDIKVTVIATGLGGKLPNSFSFAKKVSEISPEVSVSKPSEAPAEKNFGYVVPEPVKPTRTATNIELPNFLKK